MNKGVISGSVNHLLKSIKSNYKCTKLNRMLETKFTVLLKTYLKIVV